jgi:hypothetical protein
LLACLLDWLVGHAFFVASLVHPGLVKVRQTFVFRDENRKAELR